MPAQAEGATINPETAALYPGIQTRRNRPVAIKSPCLVSDNGSPILSDAETITITVVALPVDVTPPKVVASTIQNGHVERSFVDRFSIEFSEEVNLAALIANGTFANAMSLTNLGVDEIPSRHAHHDSGGPSSILNSIPTRTCGGSRGRSTHSPGQTTSLGRWILSAGTQRRSASAILAGNRLDGNSDGEGGDKYVLEFHRLEGDANGDRTVNSIDMNLVNAALGVCRRRQRGMQTPISTAIGRITVRDRLIVARNDGHAINSPSVNDPMSRPWAAGDFNFDGTVNAADYTVWRNHKGLLVRCRHGRCKRRRSGRHGRLPNLDTIRAYIRRSREALPAVNECFNSDRFSGDSRQHSNRTHG